MFCLADLEGKAGALPQTPGYFRPKKRGALARFGFDLQIDRMKTHLDVLRAIAPDRRAAMNVRSDIAGLRHLALYLLCLAGTSFWIAVAAPLWQIVLLPHGLLLVFMFTLQHECTHETPFATPLLSTVLGHFCALVLLQPFNAFRYFHLAHHRYTNDPARDPELLGGAKPETWAQMIWHVSGLPYWAAGIWLTVQNAIAPKPAGYLPERVKPRLKREAGWMLFGYVLIALSLLWSNLALWLWVIPALIAAPFLRIYLLAEHGRCPFVANMLENTRTTYTNRLVRFLAWNMPYHIEHHSAPNVPFHKLPALHDEMRCELKSVSDGYIAFTKGYTATLK